MYRAVTVGRSRAGGNKLNGVEVAGVLYVTTFAGCHAFPHNPLTVIASPTLPYAIRDENIIILHIALNRGRGVPLFLT